MEFLDFFFNTCEEDEVRWKSWLLVYRQKDGLLVDPNFAAVDGESDEVMLWWNRRRLAHSTPGNIPAIVQRNQEKRWRGLEFFYSKSQKLTHKDFNSEWKTQLQKNRAIQRENGENLNPRGFRLKINQVSQFQHTNQNPCCKNDQIHTDFNSESVKFLKFRKVKKNREKLVRFSNTHWFQLRITGVSQERKPSKILKSRPISTQFHQN